ncbi:hypothetical protein ASPZODRAFT_58004 [Penicilliopsis zonata CBS 506.65]|uniref:Sfi1 spindle body domain-containing protein n=1 Tax=Penicilliopsis zonata CBS 506.65 TaxID=1073090 RepID=A0A1L9SSA1_9EURO|nr:hypothetical protein ASPZODRAFT_58004 [Penicilliopsis zonata CBS 506.65]OJJ49981.1 hypothetical protein ASPZODRAFT_58004 [Penicilliopsis zonata CBS 506.65]
MPPISPPRGAVSYDNPQLTDQDVGALYQIVTRAGDHPDAERLPFRALFESYDQFLEEHGAAVDQGQVCLRFLFKMGRKGFEGRTLFEKFESALGQMGIVLDFDGVGEAGGNETMTTSREQWDRWHEEDATQENISTHRTPRRRASFNSMYDVGEDMTQRSFVNRPSSRSSMSRLQMGKPQFSDTRGSPQQTLRSRPQSPDRTQLLAQFLEAGRRLMNRMGSSSSEKKRRSQEQKLPNGHPAKADFKRIHSDRAAAAASWHESRSRSISDDSGEDDTDSSQAVSSAESHASASFEKQPPPPEMLYRPSPSDLLRDASTFNMYRQRAINRKILTQWMKKAVQAQQTHRNMEVVAINRDRAHLLRDAYEVWLEMIQKRREAARTERFFHHLEIRAARARDLYLMTKAFTHWAQLTSDEVARTDAARRRVLGVKYFNAWREITAVNELKAQRFALRRPFNAWRKKTHQIKAQEANAITLRETKLVNEKYWQWFWHLCDRRAPRWYDYCLKKRSLISWLRKFRTNRERFQEMEIRDKQYLLESGIQAWSQRYQAVTSANEHATSMRRQKLLRQSLGGWTTESRLAPAESRVADMVDGRLAHSALRQWSLRAQMLEQAQEIDRARLLRDAWTTWNDLLRCQALGARIQERMKMEAMYKWVLAERCRLMQRIRDQRITREVFSRFVSNIRGTYSRLLHNVDLHEDRQTEELLRSKFAIWRGQVARQRQREYAALEFYSSRLQPESFVIWKAKHQQLTEMEEWARRAHFYFLMMRVTKRWHQATQESSKRRRQDAYAKVRRRIKVTMASNALISWQSKTLHVLDLEQQAIEVCRHTTLNTSSRILHRWHQKTAQRVHDARAADGHYARQVAYEQLTRLAEVLVEHRARTDQADALYRMHVLSVSGAQLRKLSLRVFQVNSTAETADSMRDRTMRKHARSMFRLWSEKARLQIEARDSPGLTPTPAREYGMESTSQTASASAEPSSIFDPWYQVETPFKFSDLANTSPAKPPAGLFATPNYMTSPSKRAARARALARISTTPATPLYTPFASRLLQANSTAVSSPQIPPTTASHRRGRSGRGSALGASVRFVDVEPQSPTDGRKSSSRRT